MDAPGGWQIVGRTPIAPFSHSKTHPFLYKPGDLVKFQAVSREQYYHIENEVALNQYKLQEF
jgi:allophanate hydrolase subunit 1